MVAAGSGMYGAINNNYYLCKGGWYLSPNHMDPNNSNAYVFLGDYNGALFTYEAYFIGNVAPVINLSAEYASTLIGNGTMENPYREK